MDRLITLALQLSRLLLGIGKWWGAWQARRKMRQELKNEATRKDLKDVEKADAARDASNQRDDGAGVRTSKPFDRPGE